jgi:hypothetical protein
MAIRPLNIHVSNGAMKMHNCWPCSELMVVKPMDQSPTGTHQPFFTVHCKPIYKYVPRYLDFAEIVCESCAILSGPDGGWFVSWLYMKWIEPCSLLSLLKVYRRERYQFLCSAAKSLLFREGRALESYFQSSQSIKQKNQNKVVCFPFTNF